MATSPESRCETGGVYLDKGTIQRYVGSKFSTVVYLKELLEEGSSGPSDEDAEISRVELIPRTGSEPAPHEKAGIVSMALPEDVVACRQQGAYTAKFSREYGSEDGAGRQFITLSLTAAVDGSLIVKSYIFFDGSRSVFRRKSELTVWYRFVRDAN